MNGYELQPQGGRHEFVRYVSPGRDFSRASIRFRMFSRLLLIVSQIAHGSWHEAYLILEIVIIRIAKEKNGVLRQSTKGIIFPHCQQ